MRAQNTPITDGAAQPNSNTTLLEARDVRIYYKTVAGEAKVVDGVDLTIQRDEIFGLAGESGCGKSTLVEGMLRLIKPPGYIKSGSADFFPANATDRRGAIDLFKVDDREMRQLRWQNIAYVPQGA